MASINITDASQTCFVADFYHGNSVNLQKLKAASWSGVPCVGVIIKATQGAGYVDPAFAKSAKIARDAGFLVAAYHFGTAEPVSAQVKNFITHTSPDETMGLWLDFEDYPRSQMTLSMSIDFMDGCDQVTGRTTGEYSGNTIKQAIIGASSTQRDFLAAHAFWLADYALTPVMVDVNRKQLPWDVPFLHQFTGDGNGPLPHSLDGLQQGADLSIFRGSPDQLRAAWPLPKMTS